MRIAVVALALVIGCGGKAPSTDLVPKHSETGTDGLLALVPDGAQIVVELDLARLRANPVVGPAITRALARQVALPGMGTTPLAQADQVVLAAFGVGTAQAATLTLIASRAKLDVADADAAAAGLIGLTEVAPGVYGIGPPDWLASAQQRAGLASHATAEIYKLRDHAMPAGAPGAALRITARLPFDARVALARQTGLETAPSQLSVWADVADDLAIVIDADGADGKDSKDAAKRVRRGLESALALVGAEVTPLGARASIANAKFVAQGTWVRAIIAIGPAHLQRIVERATALLGPT